MYPYQQNPMGGLPPFFWLNQMAGGQGGWMPPPAQEFGPNPGTGYHIDPYNTRGGKRMPTDQPHPGQFQFPNPINPTPITPGLLGPPIHAPGITGNPFNGTSGGLQTIPGGAPGPTMVGNPITGTGQYHFTGSGNTPGMYNNMPPPAFTNNQGWLGMTPGNYNPYAMGGYGGNITPMSNALIQQKFGRGPAQGPT